MWYGISYIAGAASLLVGLHLYSHLNKVKLKTSKVKLKTRHDRSNEVFYFLMGVADVLTAYIQKTEKSGKTSYTLGDIAALKHVYLSKGVYDRLVNNADIPLTFEGVYGKDLADAII